MPFWFKRSKKKESFLKLQEAKEAVATNFSNRFDNDFLKEFKECRKILIEEEIDDEIGWMFHEQLIFFEYTDHRKPIFIYIDTPGGSFGRSLNAAHDLIWGIKTSQAEVHTNCISIAAGIGPYILAAGKNGKRACSDTGRIVLSHVHNELVDFFGLSIKKVEVDNKHGLILTPSEAISYGIIDTIYTS